MEEATKTGEDANLNSNESGDGTGTEGTQGEGSQKTTFTLEEVEAMKSKMQADGDRGVQKLINEKKNLEAVVDAVKAIDEDRQALITLSQTSPEVAKIILDKYYDGKTIEEYADIMGITIDLNDPAIVKKRIESEARKLADERIVSEKKDDFIKELKMTDAEKEQFEQAFSERKEMKSFDVKDLRKHLEKAFKEVDSDSDGRRKLEQQEAIGKATSTANGKDSSSQKDPLAKSRDEAKSFLKKHNL